MRVTAQVKEETRQRIVDAARRRFARDGFTAVTTRDLADDAGIATGTLFNYFASKEALAMTMLLEAQQRAIAEHEKRRPPGPAAAERVGVRGVGGGGGDGGEDGADLIEDLFGFIAAILRALKPHRTYLAEAIESALSPFAAAGRCAEVDAFRAEHLERVDAILHMHRPLMDYGVNPSASSDPPNSDGRERGKRSRSRGGRRAEVCGGAREMRVHLYWTLCLGILSFWSRDRSAKQEQTLAMLDQSVRMFAALVRPHEPVVDTESEDERS